MTPTELIAWWAVGLGLVTALVAGLLVMQQSTAYDGNPTLAAAWVAFGSGLAGAGFIPALILAGIRQLLPRLAAAVHVEQRHE